MSSYILPREKLNLFLASLDGFQVLAPVTRDGSCSFEPVSGRLDSVEIDLQHQPLPAKKAVFPQTETLFHLWPGGRAEGGGSHRRAGDTHIRNPAVRCPEPCAA